MPPFVPRKRVSSEDPDPPSAKRQALQNATASRVIEDTDAESSLSDVPSSDDETGQTVSKGKAVNNDDNDNDDDDDDDEDDGSDDESIDWEDAIESKTTNTTTPATPTVEPQDLELTLDKNEVHMADLLDGKKGPTKIERQIRIQTHCLHVQFLLYHNAVRNAWANDPKVHDILRKKLPAGIHKEVKKWRVASGLEAPEEKPQPKKKSKGKQRQKQTRDWGEGSSRLEPGQPDMSRGDPIIHLLKVLAAYWKKQFRITAPGLRKRGYRPMSQLEAEISSFKADPDPERHGEGISNVDAFRVLAERMEGSRDVGAQLFTALLRALDIEARLVASLQPLGFGWTKSETYTPPKPKADADPDAEQPDTEADAVMESDSSDSDATPSRTNNTGKSTTQRYDRDVPFPIYWTEVASPVTHEIIPVDPLILPNAVATTPELQAAFEPRGAKAEKAKQVISYVIAYSQDRTAKDVTTRYLRRRTWPGKTKGFRMPVEKIPLGHKKGKFFEYDWFRVIFRVYERPVKMRTMVDDIEDVKDLQPKQPDKKIAKGGDTLQSLRSSTEFALERFLRREEALRPGVTHDRTFTTGKGAKAKEEKVYRRADILKCLSAESWHKEGRQVKTGQAPLKLVPIRAVTLLRKREVDEQERRTGEKPKQGLYAKHQTEYIIPPPIQDGIIPKNEYGNMDCFVPSMVPQGAVHAPWSGTVRLCKKLGIDYAEAVTGFEFGSKMAVPVIQGVVIAAENHDLLKDAWLADNAEKQKKEQLKAEKRILQTWRKFLFGLRIAERVREEYGGQDSEREEHNPFATRRGQPHQSPPPPQLHHDSADEEDPDDRGGGFLLPGEDDGDDGGLIVDHHHLPSRPGPSEPEPEPETEIISIDDDDDDDDDDEEDQASAAGSSSIEEISRPDSPSEPDSTSEEQQLSSTRRRTRGTRGRGKRG